MKTQAKNLKYYMSLNYPFTVEQYEDNGDLRFGLQVPELPGVWADGKTIEEAYASLVESKKLWFEVRLDKGLGIPEPPSEEQFSGKFILRLNPKTHMLLSKKAKIAKKSLNQYIATLLENQISNSDLLREIKKLAKIVGQQSETIAKCEAELKSVDRRMDRLEKGSLPEKEWGSFTITVGEPRKGSFFTSPQKMYH